VNLTAPDYVYVIEYAKLYCVQGHYVSILGDIGEKDTENEVLLLEHDIPHSTFSADVLSCLPSVSWTISDEVSDLL